MPLAPTAEFGARAVCGGANRCQRFAGQGRRLSGCTAGRGLPAGESSQDAAHARMGDRRGRTARGVLVGDGGDGGPQRRDPRSGLGALGQVGGDKHGLRRQWLDILGRTTPTMTAMLSHRRAACWR